MKNIKRNAMKREVNKSIPSKRALVGENEQGIFVEEGL